jgi:ribosomal protein S18 acetylase RimI-like enzyme
MINLRLQVRCAVERDRRQISNLLFYEANTHRHLDWRSALDWIGSRHYWVLEDDGRIVAALACPQDPPHVGWVRFFGCQPSLSAADAWSVLWEIARHEIAQTDPQMQVAAIVVKHWFQSLLLSSGFVLNQNIVLLRLDTRDARQFTPPQGIRIRFMQDADLPTVTAVDLAAFGSFWHNTQDSLRRALSEAVCATVAEDVSGSIVGYQISTGNFLHAHLARLAVHPGAQGRGVATGLMGDLLQKLRVHKLEGISVNTQADNAASLSLYKKMGFTRTGEHFPVLIYM